MCKWQLPNILIMKDFDLRKYLAEGRLLKENRELSQDEVTTIYNNFMDTYKYKETVIDDPDGTKEKATLKIDTPDGKSYKVLTSAIGDEKWWKWDDEELNDLTMDIESEEGGNIYEDSLKESDSFMIPSGWTDGGEDYSDWENNPGETVIKVFSAPMEGWDKEHEDMIMIKKGIGDFNPDNEEKFFVDGYISYGDYGTPDGPFDSYDEAFKVAVGAMEELKQDWK